MFTRPKGYQYLNILKNHLNGDLGRVFNSEMIYPRQIEIHLPADHIKACNFNCYYCQGKLLERPIDLYFEEDALKLMKQLNGKIDYYIYGGAYSEPMMNPYLFEFLKTSKECGAKFGIHTNGSLLLRLQQEEEFLTKLCDIATLKEDYLSISLDAGSNESHKKIKNTDTFWFDTIIEGIKEVVKARGSRIYPAIRVCYLMNSYNSSLEELKGIMDIMKDIQVDSLKFSIPYDVYGKSFDKVRKYKNQVEIPRNKKYKAKLLKLLKNEQGTKPIIFYIPPESQDVDAMNFKQCIYSYYQITLGADGYVYKCSSTATPSFKMNRLGKITSDLEAFNKMVLMNHNAKFNPCTCFSVGARCNRMALEVNRSWQRRNNA